MTAGNGNGGSKAGKLGTFGGVFVPNVLTILGVIMFLRMGWVVGQAGLWQALVILLVAKSITVLTALSLSAVSTNTRVGAGGAYFLISRSLGPEVGGSVGIPLYFAQTISVAFYLVGFAESFSLILPDADPKAVGLVALGVFVIVAWFGAGIVAKTQYIILAALGLSLVSFFAGARLTPAAASNLGSAYTEGQNFWSVFSVFFPAVTGIMAGVSMSGDLRDPARSIPRGTLGAILVTLGIYGLQIVVLTAGADRDALVGNSLILLDLSVVPSLIYVGLWAATLSSALASLAAAPRTLQALAHDGVVPRILGASLGGGREPHAGILVSAALAGGCILAGDLNLIAPVISMFFLATYGTINLVAGIERLAGNPSYRPTFRVHWAPSLLGGLGCLAVMFLIHAPATALAMVIIVAIFFLLARARLQEDWVDMRSGLWFSVTRLGLLLYIGSRQHVRNWRPVILVLAGNPKARLPMIRFARHFEAGRGFLFIGQVVTGDEEDLFQRQPRLQEVLANFIHEHELSAAPKMVVARDFVQGVTTLLQASGIGPFQPNTVLTGWSDDAVRRSAFAQAVRRILELQRNLLVYEAPDLEAGPLEPRIDVWWYAKENGSFMLTLAYLMRLQPEWRCHRIRVLRIIRDPQGAQEAQDGMKKLVAERRVQADVEIVVDTSPPLDVIARESERSEVCFVGISVRSIQEDSNPLAAYEALVGRLRGNVFLSKSWHDLQY